MYFDRKALKQATKQMVTRGDPKPWLVTLVFMLVTTGVASLPSLVMVSPLSNLTDVVAQYYEAIYMGNLTESMMNSMLQQLIAALTGPAAMVMMVITVLISLYSMVVTFGYAGYCLRRVRNQECGYRDLFDWIHMAGKIIWLNILQAVFVYLWSLLFVIPGIVALYRYRMAVYCLLDDPDISAREAIRRSKALMNGKKGDLFVLDLSFFGWALLVSAIYSAVEELFFLIPMPAALLTLVLVLVQIPLNMHLTTYMQLSEAGFYLFTVSRPKAPPVEEPNATFNPTGPPENPFGDGGAEKPRGDDPWDIGGGDDGWTK